TPAIPPFGQPAEEDNNLVGGQVAGRQLVQLRRCDLLPRVHGEVRQFLDEPLAPDHPQLVETASDSAGLAAVGRRFYRGFRLAATALPDFRRLRLPPSVAALVERPELLGERRSDVAGATGGREKAAEEPESVRVVLNGAGLVVVFLHSPFEGGD